MMNTLEEIRRGDLNGAEHVRLNLNLRDFPSELYSLADSLEVLDLCDNQLSVLPDDMGRFTRLKAIFLFNNCFELIPSVLADCPLLDVYGFRHNRIRCVNPDILPDNLRWLILTGNQLSEIPIGLGRLKKLQKCMLAGNQLRSLPKDIAQCEGLELLRISSNQLTELPPWLCAMPRLTWLAFAGNPLCDNQKKELPTLTPIPWSQIILRHQLGQGASGVIYHAQWSSNVGVCDVAVKIFKGKITSDGSPIDERDACILAGEHPHLVKLLGDIVNHPQQKMGLVMGLIPPHYTNMAKPPTLESCTRDSYPEGAQFPLAVLLDLMTAMVSVCQHLHSCGIMHGDFYPHNILLTHQGESLLSDFGAASLFDANDQALAVAFERMEVRALGCALDDMLKLAVDDEQIKKKYLPTYVF